MKQTEIGLIPDDWEVKRLGELFEMRAGGDVNKQHFSYYKSDKYKYKIFSNGLENEGVYGFTDLPRYKGDSITITGRGTVGVSMYRKDDFDAVIRLLVLESRNKNQTNNFFISELINEVVKFPNESTGVPQLTVPQIKDVLIPLPPLPEQQRIAKALSDVDALISTTEKLIQKKKNIKQGTMQNLLTGKKRLPGFAKTTNYKQSELGLIPENWEVKSLGEIAETFTGLTYSPENVAEHGTLVLRSSNIKNEQLCFEDNVFVQMAIPERAFVKENDILICVRNGSKALIGKSAIITKAAVGMAFGAFMTVLRSTIVNQNYLLYVWQSDFVQKQVTDNLGATINQITNADFKKFNVIITPNKEEQTAIANVLSSMDKEIEILNTKLEKHRNLKTAMMQQLLTGKIRL